MTLSSYSHPSWARAALRALAPVVCPPQIVEDDLVDPTLGEMELGIRALPAVVRLGLLAGLATYEVSATAWPGGGFRRSSRLEPEAAARYFALWKKGLRIQREFVHGVRQLLTLSYYELPQVKAALDYRPEQWIEKVSKRRLESYGDEIREAEAAVTRPEPLTGVRIEAPRAAPPSAGGSADRGAIYTRASMPDDRVIDCQVVIVGSGAGGGSMAAELAEAGVDVVVLEEGGYHRTEEFNPRSSEMVRMLYRDGGASMAMGTPPVYFQEGRTVGGSTVVNGGMSWRTPDEILERWHRVDHIDAILPKDLEPFVERVERRIHVAYQDPESIGRDNQILKAGADAKGWEVIDNRRNQLHCAGTNNCAFGCPTAAKRTILVTYIPRAVHFGARVYADVRVTRILREGSRATGVEAYVMRSDGGRGRKLTVRAKLVIVAGGALQTPALLARSGFRPSSGKLGRDLSLHPNSKVMAVFDEAVRGWEGVHQAYQVREFRDQGFLMAAVNVPPSIVAMTTPLYGEELGEMMRDYNRIVTAGILVEDTTLGRVVTRPDGQPLALYQINDYDVEKLKQGTSLLCELLFGVGARKIYLPFAGMKPLESADQVRRIFDEPIPKSSIEIVTVHLMGTGRMGKDPTVSVTDSYGHVHGAEGLMINDASLFPSPIGVNPAQTIQTLSTRNAAHLLESHSRFLR